jgi:hypothetical protein
MWASSSHDHEVNSPLVLKRVTWLLLAAGLVVSCQKFAEGRQMFRELLGLREQIMKEFHEQAVDIVVANDQMTVKFINSPFKERTNEEKQQRADAVAAFVTTHYKHPLSSVITQFVTQRGGFGASVTLADGYVGHVPPKP